MAKEVLAFSESMGMEVVDVIRAGIRSLENLRPKTKDILLEWCNDREEYFRELDDRDDLTTTK